MKDPTSEPDHSKGLVRILVLIFIIALLVIFTGCKSIQYNQRSTLKGDGKIIQINEKDGYVTVLFECLNPSIIGEPCGSIADIDIRVFDKPELNKEVKIK